MARLSDVEAAAQRLASQVLETPCLESKTLSQVVGARVFLKFENLQFTASFKERGALDKLASLLESGATVPGVIAASAGNHAQGVAHHAQRLGLRAVIVMPRQRGRPHLLGGFRSPGVLSVTCRFERNGRQGRQPEAGPWPRDGICHHHVVVCLRQIDVASHVVS
jgi:hypothetical protein